MHLLYHLVIMSLAVTLCSYKELTLKVLNF